jgi:Fic family protein
MKILDFILNNKEYLEDLITRSTIQGSDHIPPEPEKVPNLMMYYIYNYNHDEQDIFSKIAKYHIEFEKIHPFEDGNGRIGRLLINYELIKNILVSIH